MSKRCAFAFVFIFGLFSPCGLCQIEPSELGQKIMVGASPRPPFVIRGQDDLGRKLLNVLNRAQSKYQFVLVEVPTARRQQAVESGLIDITLFDNLKWGWPDDAQHSIPLIDFGDVLVTLNQPDITQTVFSDLTDKSIAMVRGYRYRFTHFERDELELKKKYNAVFVNSEERTIEMVLSGKTDIGITSNTALAWYVKRFPDKRKSLFVSTSHIDDFKLHFIVPSGAPISVDVINKLLSNAEQNGQLKPLYDSFGLQKPHLLSNTHPE